ncbi:MAG: NAD(P)-dependent oxidoreductase [Hyphomicrobiaceae bacterium]
MATNIKRIIYFHYRMDPTAANIRERRPDIDMFRRPMEAEVAESWKELERTHCYHVSGRTELREPWFPDRRLFAKAPNLLAICSLGAGYDTINLDDCNEAGIIVCNQSGANKEAVAEHALGLMLSLSKKIAQANAAMRRQKDVERFHFAGNDLLGKTVGIIGIGNIGGRVAELCAGLFKMTVLAYDPYLSAEKIAAKGATKVGLEELLERADYVTMHTPLSDSSSNLMSYDQFKSMKRSAYFINTSRGGTYSEDGLVRALNEELISGAGIDVFIEEPPPTDHPLMAFENVIVSPHNAGITAEAMANVAIFSADQWIDILDGRVPPRLINREAWPKYCDRFEKILGFRPQPLPKD